MKTSLKNSTWWTKWKWLFEFHGDSISSITIAVNFIKYIARERCKRITTECELFNVTENNAIPMDEELVKRAMKLWSLGRYWNSRKTLESFCFCFPTLCSGWFLLSAIFGGPRGFVSMSWGEPKEMRAGKSGRDWESQFHKVSQEN